MINKWRQRRCVIDILANQSPLVLNEIFMRVVRTLGRGTTHSVQEVLEQLAEEGRVQIFYVYPEPFYQLAT